MTTTIKTPRGMVVQGPGGKAELKWNTNFVPKFKKKYSKTQVFIDREVARRCEPYTPFRTGMLIMSEILGTIPGSGIVRWIAPYARRQYYRKGKVGSETGALRGPFWFERWKAVGVLGLIADAKKIFREDK